MRKAIVLISLFCGSQAFAADRPYRGGPDWSGHGYYGSGPRVAEAVGMNGTAAPNGYFASQCYQWNGHSWIYVCSPQY